MKRINRCKVPFYWMLLVAVVFAPGCAGQKVKDKGRVPRAKESQTAKAPLTLDRPVKKTVVDEKGEVRIVSAPSASAKKIEQTGNDKKGPLPVRAPEVLPTPETRTSKTPTVSKPQFGGPAPRPAERQTEKKVSKERGPKIILNFDNADLFAVIHTIGDLLGINYIVDPDVSGKVTIKTSGGLYTKDLFPIFLLILEVNGQTAIKVGDLYRIVQLKDSPRMPISLRFAGDQKDVSPGGRIIIQIIPLKFLSTGEMTSLLTPFMSEGGTIIADENSNTLLMIDKWANIVRALRLVEAFDVNMFDRVSYRFYPLEHLDAEEVGAFLSDFTSYYEKMPNVLVKFIALTRLNTLLVISTTPLVFEKVEEILHRVDVAVEESEARVHVYFVKNGEAKNLGALLKKVFGKGADTDGKTPTGKTRPKPGGSARLPGNPFSESRKRERETKKTVTSPAAKGQVGKSKQSNQGELADSGALKGKIKITADDIRNALIIQAIPQDYQTILSVLRHVDVLPRQVLIEATIAEITLDANTELGMDWSFTSDSTKTHDTGLLEATVGQLGLKWAIGLTEKWKNTLNALATENKVNILSSPHVLASDNKEARIDVSREVPLASSEWTFTSGTEPVTQTNIQYRDVGVILSVIPHINDSGMVTMEISEEVSELTQSVKVANVEYPSFFKRTINTTLTVRHGQTIAIGGLIRDKEDDSMSGLPCLIHIPVFRYLFGKGKEAITKTELIVLITPRVIINTDDVDAVTAEFKSKVRNVMKRFYPQ